jgi:ATP-dependent exoDNAse (exonuclease V) alpha subunit
MAFFHMHMKSVSRASGRGAPGAAAYRAGERLRDERTGQLHDYQHRDDVSHAEIVIPSGLEASAPAWVSDRASLWNAAEAAEKQRNARVAREYEVALPVELSGKQRLELARSFARELSDRYRVVVDLTVHDPRPAGDPRNFHAHLLTTTREITASGLGPKAEPEWPGTRRVQHGLPSGRAELIAVRQRWAALTNQAFRAAGLDLQIDHRSLAAQGIDREPKPNIPYAAVQMERRGLRSVVADRIREEYRARVLARHEPAAARGSEPAVVMTPTDSSSSRVGLEEGRRRARDAWLQIRHNARANGPAVNRGSALETGEPLDAPRRHGRDQDHSL